MIFGKFARVGLLLASLSACAPAPKAQGPNPEKVPAIEEVSVVAPSGQKALTPELQKYCDNIEESFKAYQWGDSGCQKLAWEHVRNSVQGRPLPWVVYGNEEEALKKDYDTTMIFCGVHGDEITPTKFCFDIIQHLEQNRQEYQGQKKLIVVAPLVNPDSFFIARPTRTNARKVDLNRNFPTNDWWAKAIKLWKSNRSDPRRHPGTKPMSEPETVFQVNLIKRYNPDKIISVHAPLTLLDYDGPTIQPGGAMSGEALLQQMGKMAKGLQVKNFPFFPGSLGNWAGFERHIPTYTLELPSSDARKSDEFWQLFKEAIHLAITSDLRANLPVK